MSCISNKVWPMLSKYCVLAPQCRAPCGRGSTLHALRYTSTNTTQDDSLDALLKTIDGVDTNRAGALDLAIGQKRLARDVRGGSTTPQSNSDNICKKSQLNEIATSAMSDDQSQTNAKYIQESLLQSQLHSAQQELKFLQLKLSNLNQSSTREKYVPAESAKKFLSSSELIAEKSPQHFIKDTNSNEKLSRSPQLQSSGCVASISLVGRVVTEPSKVGYKSDSKSSIKRRDDANRGVSDESSRHNDSSDISTFLDDSDTCCADFTVEYEIPFATVHKTTSVHVRCYGSTLSTFALECVKQNDVVHVLGSFVPLHNRHSSEHTAAVCVLPVGGNITVVLSHDHNE